MYKQVVRDYVGLCHKGISAYLKELTTSQRWDGFRMEKKNDCNGLKHIEYIKIHHNIKSI